jgi:hypothetical protein
MVLKSWDSEVLNFFSHFLQPIATQKVKKVTSVEWYCARRELAENE